MALGRVVLRRLDPMMGQFATCSRAPQRRAPRRLGQCCGRGAARSGPAPRAACAGSGRGGAVAPGRSSTRAPTPRSRGPKMSSRSSTGNTVAHSSSSRSKSRRSPAAGDEDLCRRMAEARPPRPRRPPGRFRGGLFFRVLDHPLATRVLSDGAGLAQVPEQLGDEEGLPSVSRKSVSASPRPSSLNAWPAAASMRDCTPFSSRPSSSSG